MSGPERVKQCREGMVMVRGGTFEMGSTNGDPNERAVRSVRVTTFCLDEHEFANEDKGSVTMQTARAFEAIPIACGSGRFMTPLAGRHKTAKEAWDANIGSVDFKTVCSVFPQPIEPIELPQSPKGFDGPKQPLIANWNQANAICKAQRKRLPTEAEQEYVMRGESHKQEYATRDGEKPTHSQARFGEGPTVNVCSYRGNYVAWDGKEICDLAGNVWEWASDWYQNSYEGLGNVNPTGPLVETGTKVLRGGGWYYGSFVDYLRAAYRFFDVPGFSYIDVGFRCASSPED